MTEHQVARAGSYDDIPIYAKADGTRVKIPLLSTPPNPAVINPYFDDTQDPPALTVHNGTEWVAGSEFSIPPEYVTQTEGDARYVLLDNFEDLDLLAKIKNVDGAGSLLDSDTVDGQHASSFAATVHQHDSRYYTETETDSLLAGKSDTSHNHDARYLHRDGI